MSRVAIVRCESYELDVVRCAVNEALRLIPESEQVFAPGKRVLLKPNLLSSTHALEEAVNTHPAVCQALAEAAVERGAEVLIGDSCGCLGMGSTSRAIDVTRLHEVGRETGAKIVNFDKEPAVAVKAGKAKILKSFRVPSLVREVDALVTVPKFKTHALTLLTGAVKNFLGLIPGKGKKDVHVMAPKPRAMATALVDLYAEFPASFALMDAVIGMEGEGPAGGRPREVRCLLASADAVAMDAVMGAMMGFGPRDVDTTVLAAERGLGVADLDRIEIVGLPLEQARIADWAHPSGALVRRLVWRLTPGPIFSWAFSMVGSTHATVDPEQCRECGLCVDNCPVGGLTQTENGIRSVRKNCIACYCCAEVCPHNAIVMQRSPAARAIKAFARLLRGRRPGAD